MGKRDDKNQIIFTKKKDYKDAKITKRSHDCEVYASTYNVETSNSFNAELQFKDSKFVIRNKLIDSFTELRGFKFVTALVLEFKKIENDNKTKYSTFY